jgi:hypothetical protein
LLTSYATAAADGNNTAAGCRRAVEAKLEENDRRMAKEVLQQLQLENSVCIIKNK